MLSFEDVNVIGDILDTSWGKWSTMTSPTVSCKAQFLGDTKLKIMYTTVVSFRDNDDMRTSQPYLNKAAVKTINSRMKDLRHAFKDRTGRTVKTKKAEEHDSFELINYNIHTPLRRAYFRKQMVFDLLT